MDKDKSAPFPWREGAPATSDATNNPPEGIFYYDSGERLAAANALYSAVYNDVQYELDLLTNKTDAYWWVGVGAGVVVGIVGGPVLGATVGVVGTVGLTYSGTLAKWATDAPDDVANQITNCFASDYCAESAKDSDNWKDPGAGFGVSPDNILDHFDAPSAKSPNGVYGYHERMKYRGKRYSQIYKWLPSAGTRPVCGTVTKNGAPSANVPAPDAHVEVPGVEGASQVTDANGQFCFDAIPGGNLAIHSWKTYINGSAQEQWEGKSCFLPDPTANSLQWMSADCETFTAISNNPISRTDVTLNSPDTQYRKVIVTGGIALDYYHCYSSNAGYNGTYYGVCTVGPHAGEDVAALTYFNPRTQCADGAGLGLGGTCTWLPGGKVHVDITGTFYSSGGGTCGANDVRDTQTVSVVTLPDGSQPALFASGQDFMTFAHSRTVWCPWPNGVFDQAWVMGLTAKNVVAD